LQHAQHGKRNGLGRTGKHEQRHSRDGAGKQQQNIRLRPMPEKATLTLHIQQNHANQGGAGHQ